MLRFDSCVQVSCLTLLTVIFRPTPKTDVAYDVAKAGEVTVVWDTATKHCGVEELRGKRGRPPKAEMDRKEQIALRLDAECLPSRSLSTGWQTVMNAVLKSRRVATVLLGFSVR